MDNPIQQSNDDQGLLGPTFPALQSRQRKKLILKYAWQHQRLQICAAIGFFILVIIGSIFWSELHLPTTTSETPKGLIGWLINAQSIISFGTLLVALLVWWGETQEDWIDSLSKKLSVFFFFKDRPLIVCRYVWLAGADEIRTWGQQVAKQAQPSSPNQPNLDFYPDVETREPILLLGPEGEIWKHYSVCFRLWKLNPILTDYTRDNPGYCRYQNLAENQPDPKDILQKEVVTVSEVADWKATVSHKLFSKSTEIKAE